jgi:hypothetical protein
VGTLGTEVESVGIPVGVLGVDALATLGTGVMGDLVEGGSANPGGTVLVALGWVTD